MASTFKIVFQQKFLWSFIDFFFFYIPNSLEEWTENSGVLLNWKRKRAINTILILQINPVYPDGNKAIFQIKTMSIPI